MALLRDLGRWSLTTVAINSIIGSGIFGLTGELNAVLGQASPIAMVLGLMIIGIVAACTIEVASQFTESGGPYLYVSEAFGAYAGSIVGWFTWVALVGGAAANASLFTTCLALVFPLTAQTWIRAGVLAVLIFIPTAMNYRGIRQGAILSALTAIAKIIVLLALITAGVLQMKIHHEWAHVQQLAAPGWREWTEALLLTLFGYSGFHVALLPSGEVKYPRRSVPFAVVNALLLCGVLYTCLQWVTVMFTDSTNGHSDVAHLAFTLVGSRGAILVNAAIMCAAYGHITAKALSTPRLVFSFAEHGQMPGILRKLHHRFGTPYASILLFGAVVWLLAVTGSFRSIVSFTADSLAIMYVGICATLLRLRKTKPEAKATRITAGNGMAVTSIVISLALLLRAHLSETILLAIILVVATINWRLAIHWTHRYRVTAADHP